MVCSSVCRFVSHEPRTAAASSLFSFFFFFLSPLDPYKTCNRRVRFVVTRARIIVKRRSWFVSLIRLAGDYFPVNLEKSLEYIFREFFYVSLLHRGIILSASRGITGTDRRWIFPSYIGQLPREIRWLHCTYSSYRAFRLISASRTLLLNANLYFHRDEF